MADNVDWILAQAPTGSKVVLWAHNGHVSKTGMGSTSMGSHLAKRHGKDYVVLGFAAHQGRYTAIGQGTGLGTHVAPASQPGSVEYYAHASGLRRMIIDLRRASKDDPASAWLTRALDHRSIGALAHNMSHPSVLPEEYDALIAFDDTTASKCLRFATPVWTPTAHESLPNTSGWKVLFADTFDRRSLGEAWTTRTGAWSVADGALKGVLESSLAGMRADASVDLNGRTLPPRVEVRFECRTSAPLILSASLTNDRRDGVAVELRGTPDSDLLSRDGKPGQKAAVVRGHLNEFLAGNPAFALEPNKSYRARIVRDAGKVTVVVDDVVVVATDIGAEESPKNSALSFSARSGKAGTVLVLDKLEIRTP
jgi:hypothetical protein